MIEKLGGVHVERRNQYIWLTIYSDLITNLYILFLALYALSFFGPDAIPDAMASMKERLEFSRKASPWYEDLTRHIKNWFSVMPPLLPAKTACRWLCRRKCSLRPAPVS